MQQLNLSESNQTIETVGFHAFPLHKLLHQATSTLKWVSPSTPSFSISNEISFLSHMAAQLKSYFGALSLSEQEQIKTYLNNHSRRAVVQEIMMALFKPDILMCFRHRERVVAECLYDIVLALT